VRPLCLIARFSETSIITALLVLGFGIFGACTLGADSPAVIDFTLRASASMICLSDGFRALAIVVFLSV
jgi:hypothetical protein